MSNEVEIENLTDLERVIRGTVRLHELIEVGKGESQEADDVRDAMDFPLQRLSTHEAETARMVSAAIQDRAWIPVRERLPEPGESVVVWSAGSVDMAARRDGKWIHEVTGIGETLRTDAYPPTHWMPKPGPPGSDFPL